MRIPDVLQPTKARPGSQEFMEVFEFNVLQWADNIIRFLKDTFNLNSVSKTASFTQDKPNIYLCNATGGAITVTLLTAAKWKDKDILVKKTDASANAVVIDGNAAETIDGAATLSLAAQYNAARLFSDGTSIHILSKYT